MKTSHPALSRLLSAAVFALFVNAGAGQGSDEIHYGEPIHMGRCTVRAYLAFGAAAKPMELGVLMSAGAFEQLTAGHGTTGRCFDLNVNGHIDYSGECEGDYDYALALPAVVADCQRCSFSVDRRQLELARPRAAGNSSMCAPIKQPSAWQIAGYYPTRYCIRYHQSASKYRISPEDLEYRKAG